MLQGERYNVRTFTHHLTTQGMVTNENNTHHSTLVLFWSENQIATIETIGVPFHKERQKLTPPHQIIIFYN
jgi:hypothetical protein